MFAGVLLLGFKFEGSTIADKVPTFAIIPKNYPYPPNLKAPIISRACADDKIDLHIEDKVISVYKKEL